MNERDRRKDNREDDRPSRTYNINNSWYFELRGGGQQGPFDTEAEMKAALDEFIALQIEHGK